MGVCVPATDAVLVVLAGMIAGSVLGRSISGLVAEPLWIMLLVGAVLAGAVLGRARTSSAVNPTFTCVVCLLVGLASGVLLPADLPPPRTVVSTHAVAAVTLLGAASARSSDLFAALQTLDEHPEQLVGRRIAISGLWHPQTERPASVAQRVMACCAADAIDVGFDVIPRRQSHIGALTPVRVNGIVHAVMIESEVRYQLDDATVTVLRHR